ncbi:sensor histidine kinase [Defluviitalea saccharophila]|uniref:histidine kinase n=1 Tax=Defluviitalea saccharophila TaxID=879970 RepID=A0ABZ2Y8P6_9FIRM
MTTQRNIGIIRIILFLVNFITVIFLAAIIYRSTKLIIWDFHAREFLESIQYIPVIPWKVPAYSILLLLVFLLSIELRERFFKESSTIQILWCVFDILICIIIIYLLNMGHKSLLLLPLTNIIIYIDGKKSRSLFIAFTLALYSIFDYDILSVKLNMVSINEYIQYFNPTLRLYLQGIKSILFSANQMLFIIFMVFVVQKEIDENVKIRELYDKLVRTTEELRVVNIQLEDYAKKSEEMAKIKERNRLAREIHDIIGHTLTGISTGLDACLELIDIDSSKTKHQLRKIADLARQGLLDVRKSVKQLRPDALERYSLVSAIQKLADNINECTSTKVEVQIRGDESRLNGDEEEAVYRVVQESITNAVRHGQAQNIKISLIFNEDKVEIDIIDDGIGCANIHQGFGLKHITERVLMLQGNARFRSEEGKGFQVIVDIPVRNKAI